MKKNERLQRWEIGILVCVVIFMSATETSWWWRPLIGIGFCAFIGFVQKKEIEANKPKPMATPKKGYPR